MVIVPEGSRTMIEIVILSEADLPSGKPAQSKDLLHHSQQNYLLNLFNHESF